jgi:hypothetical protein
MWIYVLMVVICRRSIEEYITCEYVLQASRSQDVQPADEQNLVSGTFALPLHPV